MTPSATGEWKPDQHIAGRYRVRSPLGRGAGGSVLSVSPAGKAVVIKPLPQSVIERPAAMVRLREISLKLAGLAHAGLWRVVEIGVDTSSGRAFIASELVEGPSLHELVAKRGPLDPREAMAVLSSAAGALAAAHEAGVVHGDLKPEHLILGKDGMVRVIDFGLERATPFRANPRLSRAGFVLGTPEFVAPEVARGEVADARSDIYALGAAVVEALTGQPPWSGDVERVLQSRVTAMPPSPTASCPGLDRKVDSLVLRALAPDARSRWADMAELSRNAHILAMAQPPPDVTGIELEFVSHPPARVARPLGRVQMWNEAVKSWRGANLPRDPQGLLVSDEEIRRCAAPPAEGAEEVQELDWLKMSLSPEQMRAMTGKFSQSSGELPTAPPLREAAPARRHEPSVAPAPVSAVPQPTWTPSASTMPQPSAASISGPRPAVTAAAIAAARPSTPEHSGPTTLAPYTAASDAGTGSNRLYWIIGGAVLVLAVVLMLLQVLR
jgi:serine/threonine protein kinase